MDFDLPGEMYYCSRCGWMGDPEAYTTDNSEGSHPVCDECGLSGQAWDDMGYEIAGSWRSDDLPDGLHNALKSYLQKTEEHAQHAREIISAIEAELAG